MIAVIEIEKLVTLQGDLSSLGWDMIYSICIRILTTLANFDDSSFSQCRDIIGGCKMLNSSCDPNQAPFKGHLSAVCWDFI